MRRIKPGRAALDNLRFLLVLAVAVPFAVAALPAQEPPKFILHTRDGSNLPAPVSQLNEDWSILLGGKNQQVLAARDWIALRQDGAALPPFPEANYVLLTDGERISLKPGAPFRVEDERLFVLPEAGAEISVPLAFLTCLCSSLPDGTVEPGLFLARLQKAKRPRDVLYLKNGDRIEGTLVSPTRGATYTMNLGERSVETPHDQLAVLAVNTELQAQPRTKKTFAHVVTTTGARLHFGNLRLELKDNMFVGKTVFGATMKLPLANLAALSLRQGQAVYLSDLVPKSYEFTPFTNINWPLVRDADVNGRQLLVDGQYYDKGLGMHARSRVAYALDGAYEMFEARVGVASEGAKAGEARVSIELDGRAVINRQQLTGGESGLSVRLDVRQARVMTLFVDFGNFGDVQARVNWADARIIRARER